MRVSRRALVVGATRNRQPRNTGSRADGDREPDRGRPPGYRCMGLRGHRARPGTAGSPGRTGAHYSQQQARRGHDGSLARYPPAARDGRGSGPDAEADPALLPDHVSSSDRRSPIKFQHKSRRHLGEQPSTQKGLSDALIRAGFKRCSIGHARGFAGLVLKPSSG